MLKTCQRGVRVFEEYRAPVKSLRVHVPTSPLLWDRDRLEYSSLVQMAVENLAI